MLPLPSFRVQQLIACKCFFVEYSWPGNVRELRNLMERVALYCSAYPEKAISEEMLASLSPERKWDATSHEVVIDKSKEPLTDVMNRFDGDRKAVAQHLGISRTTLWRRLSLLEKANQVNHDTK